jgi:hypothetical protein
MVPVFAHQPEGLIVIAILSLLAGLGIPVALKLPLPWPWRLLVLAGWMVGGFLLMIVLFRSIALFGWLKERFQARQDAETNSQD